MVDSAEFADSSWVGPGESSEAPRSIGPSPAAPSSPAGDVYDWYVRGRDLLSRGDAAAAVQILTHTVAAEPQSRSAREMLARAQYDARQYQEAVDNFRQLVESDPADHYAHFGLGLAARKVGDPQLAVEHFALAAAMRPDLSRYARELQSARSAAARKGQA